MKTDPAKTELMKNPLWPGTVEVCLVRLPEVVYQLLTQAGLPMLKVVLA